jgi:hypothetical protein
MSEASAAVLSGVVLGTDVDFIRHPQRYVDNRGMSLWNLVMEILAEGGGPDSACTSGPNPSASGTLPDRQRTPGPSYLISDPGVMRAP